MTVDYICLWETSLKISRLRKHEKNVRNSCAFKIIATHTQTHTYIHAHTQLDQKTAGPYCWWYGFLNLSPVVNYFLKTILKSRNTELLQYIFFNITQVDIQRQENVARKNIINLKTGFTAATKIYSKIKILNVPIF